MSFKIVTDSSSNLYTLPGCDYAYVPLKINCDEGEFIDNTELDVAAMNAVLKNTKGRSGTSCPNTQDWLEAFGDADELFIVTITSNLSGSYASAEIAAKEYLQKNPDKKATVIDFILDDFTENDNNADQERKEWLTKLSETRRNEDEE